MRNKQTSDIQTTIREVQEAQLEDRQQLSFDELFSDSTSSDTLVSSDALISSDKLIPSPSIDTTTIDLIDELRADAITIGNEANLSRAFPYIKDGLKPSQRATLWAAYEHGYTSDKPHIKSLKLDGQIVGEFWPHGSEYSTIVRLTQPFVMNMPLLDMHGANGSQLGTPNAAASRYTEVRLAKCAEDGLLSNIKKDTCEWIPNYSEDKEWPKLLPALLPNLYVNGSSGMGYCYSQSWVPGNLSEFANAVTEYIECKNDCKNDYNGNQSEIEAWFDKVSKTLAPDFPTGGIIVNKDELESIYKTGTGTVVLRGKVNCEESDKLDMIEITELPYQVYVTPFLEELYKLVKPQKVETKDGKDGGSGGSRDNKGTKVASKVTYKPPKIAGVTDVYNLSGNIKDANGNKKIGIDIVIDCEKGKAQYVLQQLYQYSSLQINLSVNQTGIIDGIPEVINFKQYVEEYIKFNIENIVKEYTYDLNKSKSRLEIVQGLILAVNNIDLVISIIRSSKTSDAAIKALMSNSVLNCTENQAKAIIDMKLGKLANLEITNLTSEEKNLNKTIKSCEKLLSSPTLQEKEFITRLKAFNTKYGWERRTQLTNIDLEAGKQALRSYREQVRQEEKNQKDEEEFLVLILPNNQIKRVSLGSGKSAAAKEKLIEKVLGTVPPVGNWARCRTSVEDAINNWSDGNRNISCVDTAIYTIAKAKDRLVVLTSKGVIHKFIANKVPVVSQNSNGVDITDKNLGLISKEDISVDEHNEYDEDVIAIFNETEFIRSNTEKIVKDTKDTKDSKDAKDAKAQVLVFLTTTNTTNNSNNNSSSISYQIKKVYADPIITISRIHGATFINLEEDQKIISCWSYNLEKEKTGNYIDPFVLSCTLAGKPVKGKDKDTVVAHEGEIVLSDYTVKQGRTSGTVGLKSGIIKKWEKIVGAELQYGSSIADDMAKD